ncbi:MAG: MBL fold metallo-hydrolase [Clostridium fessum]
MKSQGIRTLDWILVSHADADHTNGIEWLLKEEADIRVRNLALPAAGKGQEAYKNWKLLPENGGGSLLSASGRNGAGKKPGASVPVPGGGGKASRGAK